MTLPRNLRLHAAIAVTLTVFLLTACGSPDPIPATIVPAAASPDTTSTPTTEKPTPTPTSEKSYATIALSRPTNTSNATPTASGSPTATSPATPTASSTPVSTPAIAHVDTAWNAFFEQQDQALRALGDVSHVRVDDVWTEGEEAGAEIITDFWFDTSRNAARIELTSGMDFNESPLAFVIADGTTTWLGDGGIFENGGSAATTGCLGVDQLALNALWCTHRFGRLFQGAFDVEDGLFSQPPPNLVESDFHGTPALLIELPFDLSDEDETQTEPFRWYVHRDTFLPLGLYLVFPAEPGDTVFTMDVRFTYVSDDTSIEAGCFHPASLGNASLPYGDDDVGASTDLTDVAVSLGATFGPVGNIPELTLTQVIPGCHRPDEVNYDRPDNEFRRGSVVLHVWEPSGWEAYQANPWSLLWESECAESTRVDIDGGYAIITATWDEPSFGEWVMSGSTECPTEPRNRYMARVFYDELVVTINVPVPDADSGGKSFNPRPGPYHNIDDIRAVINALQRTPVE